MVGLQKSYDKKIDLLEQLENELKEVENRIKYPINKYYKFISKLNDIKKDNIENVRTEKFDYELALDMLKQNLYNLIMKKDDK